MTLQTAARAEPRVSAAKIPVIVAKAIDYRALLGVLAAALFLFSCGSESTTITWQDTSENEKGFRIYRITNQEKKVIAEVGPNTTQYTDEKAPPDACYVVTAFNEAGESPATNSVCAGAVD